MEYVKTKLMAKHKWIELNEYEAFCSMVKQREEESCAFAYVLKTTVTLNAYFSFWYSKNQSKKAKIICLFEGEK